MPAAISENVAVPLVIVVAWSVGCPAGVTVEAMVAEVSGEPCSSSTVILIPPVGELIVRLSYWLIAPSCVESPDQDDLICCTPAGSEICEV